MKAQGDGWLLTVALIEGSNLAAVDASGFSDPYVVFTCNGKTRTSSIKFQKSNPQWNGNFYIFEFDHSFTYICNQFSCYIVKESFKIYVEYTSLHNL